MEDLQTINISDIEYVRAPTADPHGKKKSQEKKGEIDEEVRWVWTTEMVASLVQCLVEYKRVEQKSGSDWQGDPIKLYSELRMAMGRLFEKEDFGPLETTLRSTEDMTKDE